MQPRPLGRSGLSVPPLCLGANVFGWTADESASFAILDEAMAGGLSFIDTADVYSTWVPGHQGGESEAIIGRWMKARGNRSRIILATKVGSEMGPGRKGLKREYIRRAVEDSLTRLQTDVIDLYQSHRDDPETPQEETLSAYADLIRDGKVRAIGASNFSAARLQESVDISARTGLPRYESLQPLYNLADRSDYEGDLAEVCTRNGIGVIPYSGLAAGFLTGKYRSEADFGKSPRGVRMAKYLDARGRRILAALDAVAAETRSTPTQVALAWLMARPSITAPIASASRPEQVGDLAAAMSLGLSSAALTELDRAGR